MFQFYFNLFLTVLIEALCAYFVSRKKYVVWLSVALNLITNPCLNIYLSKFMFLTIRYFFVLTLIVEFIVVIIEMFLYMWGLGIDSWSAFKLSMLLNSASFVFGGVFWIVIRFVFLR